MPIRSMFILVLLVLVSGTAHACRGITGMPAREDIGRYQVLAVEVTGIHLTDYEWYRAAELKLKPWPKLPNGESAFYVLSATPTFKVQALVRAASSGSSEPVREFTLYGCGMRVPDLQEPGLIFVAPDGLLGAVWKSQEPEYSRWVEELGFKLAEP